MIDYALKEPKNPNNINLNIELINLHNDKYFENNSYSITNENELLFFKIAFKFPYISSEILSMELQLILDKLIPFLEMPNLEESKSYLLNLSSDSINNTLSKLKEEISEDIILVDEMVKREPNFLFDPPEIECGYEKEKIEIMMNYSKDKDYSLNTSLERKFTYSYIENFEIIDYIFSFINYDLNTVQSSYFAKIILNILKSQTKCNLLIKYICFRKPEILINLINNLHNRGVCDVIIKLLLTDNLNLEDSMNLDNVKLMILNRLIARFYMQLQITNFNSNNLHNNSHNYFNFDDNFYYSNVSYILSEFLENTKTLDLALNDNFLNNVSIGLNSIKNKNILKEFLNFLITFMKQFKIEYEKAQKFVTSISMRSKILEKTNILSLDLDVNLINKFTNSLDNILELFTENKNNIFNVFGNLKITILEFILTFLTISRNHLILDKFIQYDFFNLIWKYFFKFDNNNILHNLIEQIVIILIEDTSDDLFVEYFFIKSKFMIKVKKYCNTQNENFFYNFGNGKKMYKGYYIQVCKIFQIILNNLHGNSFLKKLFAKSENQLFLENLVNFYELHFKSYVEKMNYSLGNYKINFNQPMIETNDEYLNKKFDFEMQIQEMNKNLDNEEMIDNNRDFNEDFGDGEFLENNSNSLSIDQAENDNINNFSENENLSDEKIEFYDNIYWRIDGLKINMGEEHNMYTDIEEMI